jgi:streptogramin lyase
MGAVAVGTEAIWVDEPGAGRLLRIDPRTRKVVASVAIGRSTFGSSLALGRLLWAVTDRGLVAVDPSSGAVRTRVSLAGAHAVAVDGGRVWAVGRDGLYSITRGMATRRLALPQSAADLVATADGLVWFSDSAANSLGRFHG